MKQIYRTTIQGQVLESDSLRDLLARAVSQMREMKRRMKVASGPRTEQASGLRPISALASGSRISKQTE